MVYTSGIPAGIPAGIPEYCTRLLLYSSQKKEECQYSTVYQVYTTV